MRRNDFNIILLHAQILSFTCESRPFADGRGVVRPLRSPGYGHEPVLPNTISYYLLYHVRLMAKLDRTRVPDDRKEQGSSDRMPRGRLWVSPPHCGRGLGGPRDVFEFSSKNAGFRAFLLRKLLVARNRNDGLNRPHVLSLLFVCTKRTV